MASLSMLEARLRRKTKNHVKEMLSVQHVLACSVYNQGCQGGYAYLVLKFGQEIELLPEKCMKYQVIIY
jgi:cathepsin C